MKKKFNIILPQFALGSRLSSSAGPLPVIVHHQWSPGLPPPPPPPSLFPKAQFDPGILWHQTSSCQTIGRRVAAMGPGGQHVIGSGWGDRRGCRGQRTIDGRLWVKAHDQQQAMGSAVGCGDWQQAGRDRVIGGGLWVCLPADWLPCFLFMQ